MKFCTALLGAALVLCATAFSATRVAAAPVKDLARAVAAAPDGAQLELVGRYRLNSTLVIRRSITLSAPPAERRTQTQGASDTQPPTIEFTGLKGAVIDVKGGALNLNGLRVTGAKGGCGVLVEGSAKANVNGCLIVGNAAGGVKAIDSAWLGLNGCICRENGAFGVYVGGSARATVSGCDVSANKPAGNGGSTGFVATGDVKAELTGCNMTSNSVGMAVGGRAAVKLTGCALANNPLGLRFADQSAGSLTGCVVGRCECGPNTRVAGLGQDAARYGNAVTAG